MTKNSLGVGIPQHLVDAAALALLNHLPVLVDPFICSLPEEIKAGFDLPL